MVVWERPWLVQGCSQSAAVQCILNTSDGVDVMRLKERSPACLERAGLELGPQERRADSQEHSVQEAENEQCKLLDLPLSEDRFCLQGRCRQKSLEKCTRGQDWEKD